MTFKSIDLQMSIPRTPEASGIHGHMQHRPQAEQQLLGNMAAKETEKLRHKNTEVEESTGQKIRDDRQRDSNGQHDERRHGKGHEEQAAAQPSIHPYKGKHIDITF